MGLLAGAVWDFYAQADVAQWIGLFGVDMRLLTSWKSFRWQKTWMHRKWNVISIAGVSGR